MSRKVFTAGEVLAAADVNSFLMDQSVMSFAGTAARGSAIPTPVEGMVAYLEDANLVTLYNGSAWVAAANNTGSGLVHIQTQTFSSVGAVNFDNVFSSTYKKYRVMINIDGSSGALSNSFRFRSGGSPDTSAAYDLLGQPWNASGILGYASVNNGTLFGIGASYNYGQSGFTLDIFQPFQAARTIMSFYSVDQPSATGMSMFLGAGAFDDTTSFDGFSFFLSGTFSGNISVYGYKE